MTSEVSPSSETAARHPRLGQPSGTSNPGICFVFAGEPKGCLMCAPGARYHDIEPGSIGCADYRVNGHALDMGCGLPGYIHQSAGA